jgi:hypothetical protein
MDTIDKKNNLGKESNTNNDPDNIIINTDILSSSSTPKTIVESKQKLQEAEKELNEMKDMLNKFYQLKNNYDTVYNDYKKSLLKNNTLNMKEKRKELLKYKRKCINCGNVGGTIFKTDKNLLEAKCGSISKQCDLDIKIEKGDREYIYDELNIINGTIEDVKKEIIINKLNLLFQYESENDVLNEFKSQLSELQEFMDMYNDLITAEIDITHNTKNKIALKNLASDKNDILQKIKDFLEEYDKNKNISPLKDIVNIYKDELYPLIEKESNIKYKHKYIEYNEKNNNFQLYTKKYDVCDLIYIWSDFKIIKDSKKNK